MATPQIISGIFGDKPFYQSLTAWGIATYVGLEAMASTACESGLLSFETCGSIETAGAKIGSVLVVLGLRKAATSKNTS